MVLLKIAIAVMLMRHGLLSDSAGLLYNRNDAKV